MKRGQSATEFVALASVMFLFFSLAFIYLESLLVDYTQSGRDSQMEAIQLSVQKELDLASRMPDGYQRKFRLPDSIQGSPYIVKIETEPAPLKDSLVVVLFGHESVVYLDEDVSGALKPGLNTLTKNGGLVFS